MIGDFLRGLAEAISQPSEKKDTYDARLLPRFGWQCSCGAHSRVPGFLSEYDAQYTAQRHQWGKGINHPMPEIVPEDAPGI